MIGEESLIYLVYPGKKSLKSTKIKIASQQPFFSPPHHHPSGSISCAGSTDSFTSSLPTQPRVHYMTPTQKQRHLFFRGFRVELLQNDHPSCHALISSPKKMGVSKNRGTPKWMVKIMENPIF